MKKQNGSAKGVVRKLGGRKMGPGIIVFANKSFKTWEEAYRHAEEIRYSQRKELQDEKEKGGE